MTYITIPINNELKSNLKIKNKKVFITSIDLMNNLSLYTNYPIKKDLAILRILDFLKYVDTKMDKDDGNITMMHSDILCKYFRHENYVRFIEILKELKVISAIPHEDGSFYIKGALSKRYRLYSSYAYAPLCLVLFDIKATKEIKIDSKKDYSKKLVDTIKRVDIDYVSAVRDEIKNHRSTGTSLNNLRMRISKILSLNDIRYIRKGIKVDRIYHSLSNLSKVARKHLTIKGQPFIDIDIRNCQPLLLCYLLKSAGLPIDEKYINDCENGSFYERFITAERDRDEVKVELYKSIFFDFKSKRVINKDFAQLYPMTYSSLEQLNKKEETIASQLQNIEASIFNTLQVDKSKHYYTLFDSIYYTDNKDTMSLIKQIKNKFDKVGLSVQVTLNGSTEYDIVKN